MGVHFDCFRPTLLASWPRRLLAHLDDLLHPLFRARPDTPVRRILVLRQDCLGDAAVTIPLLRRLREGLPHARLDVLCSPVAAELLAHPAFDVAGRSLVDRIHVSDPRWFTYGEGPRFVTRAASGLRTVSRLLTDARIRALRQERYDLVIDCVGRRRNLILSLMLGAKWRFGIDVPGGSFVLHQRIPVAVDASYGESLMRLLDPLGLPAGPDAGHGPRKTAGPSGPVVGFHLGHSGARSRKWSAAHWGRLAGLLHKGGVKRIVLMTGPGEDLLAAEVQGVVDAWPASWILAPTPGIESLVSTLQGLDLVVCIDSGPMHVADALGVPMVAIFNGSDPVLWGPRGVRTRIERELEGGACFFRARCQTGMCINAVAPERVASAVMTLLGSA